MEKIDRLGWVGGMAFVAYGVRIGIRVNDPGMAVRPTKWYKPFMIVGQSRLHVVGRVAHTRRHN